MPPVAIRCSVTSQIQSSSLYKHKAASWLRCCSSPPLLANKLSHSRHITAKTLGMQAAALPTPTASCWTSSSCHPTCTKQPQKLPQYRLQKTQP
jgi:hypothetical protein